MIEQEEQQLIDTVSDMRKATFEFALSQTPVNHGRMIDAQVAIFDFVRDLIRNR